jgi:hypothetical protein
MWIVDREGLVLDLVIKQSTGNKIAKNKMTRQTMVQKILYRQLKIEQHNPI